MARSSYIALPLEPWRCVECGANLKGLEAVNATISEFYDGIGKPPEHYVAFCDDVCADFWWSNGHRTTEGDDTE